MNDPYTRFKAIAFDADDTLWHTENLFQDTQNKLASILERYAPRELVDEKLYETEKKNVELFGFGIKGFTLSMVETAIEISDGLITAYDIHAIIMQGKEMLSAPLVLMPNVEDVLTALGRRHNLYLITKGDMLDQNNKIEQSGLRHHFDITEIVSHKDSVTYQDIFKRMNVRPSEVMMIGNSVPSDVIPVIDIGGYGVHIPYETTAIHEQYKNDPTSDLFFRLNSILGVPALIRAIDGNS